MRTAVRIPIALILLLFIFSSLAPIALAAQTIPRTIPYTGTLRIVLVSVKMVSSLRGARLDTVIAATYIYDVSL